VLAGLPAYYTVKAANPPENRLLHRCRSPALALAARRTTPRTTGSPSCTPCLTNKLPARHKIVGEIEELLTGTRHAPQPTRILATVLFTDICGSTERAAELGDARWREVLARHDDITRRHVTAAGGTPVKSTGDGHLATFSGPAAAIRCTEAMPTSLRATACISAPASTPARWSRSATTSAGSACT
jgi:class 3 adenylate cyclase